MTTRTIELQRPASAPWRDDPAGYWGALTSATQGLDTPLGAIDASALAANAHDMLDRAQASPIRVASKSIRVRGVLEAVLALPGYRGVLAYTLAEALWLAENGIEDVVVGYPSADRSAIARLAASQKLASRVTVMVDDVAQLDLIDEVVAPRKRRSIRVCLELDASLDAPLLGHLGVRRSPVHTPEQARALAEQIVARQGFTLVGMMAYEAQIAGVTNKGKPIVQAMQRTSARELRERRGEAVRRVREIAELEFVNGGGTGSLESTHDDPSVTEIAAGSGLFGPHLFDGYRQFTPAPAAAFALSVVRRPTDGIATLLGGGWIASGPSQPDRLPQLAWPAGLRMLPREGAGEVQTPVTGDAARVSAGSTTGLQIGDRVWLRHTKAGEASEHLNAFALVRDGEIVDELPTYRGEGKAFL